MKSALDSSVIVSALCAGDPDHQACRKVGYATTTYYRWKSLQENPASIVQVRVSELESEVGWLKLLVAELAEHEPERVDDGHGPVPVEDETHR